MGQITELILRKIFPQAVTNIARDMAPDFERQRALRETFYILSPLMGGTTPFARSLPDELKQKIVDSISNPDKSITFDDLPSKKDIQKIWDNHLYHDDREKRVEITAQYASILSALVGEPTMKTWWDRTLNQISHHEYDRSMKKFEPKLFAEVTPPPPAA